MTEGEKVELAVRETIWNITNNVVETPFEILTKLAAELRFVNEHGGSSESHTKLLELRGET